MLYESRYGSACTQEQQHTSAIFTFTLTMPGPGWDIYQEGWKILRTQQNNALYSYQSNCYLVLVLNIFQNHKHNKNTINKQIHIHRLEQIIF